MKITKIRWS